MEGQEGLSPGMEDLAALVVAVEEVTREGVVEEVIAVEVGEGTWAIRPLVLEEGGAPISP
jgi:hypothetical protein